MDGLCVDPGIVKGEANLYAYIVERDVFEDIALAFYMSSGKFDKNSINRWSRDEIVKNKYKSQNIRASIDNTVIFLPVGNTKHKDVENIAGSILFVCYKDGETVIVAIGIIKTQPFTCPDQYKITKWKKIIPVHILSTSCDYEISLERLTSKVGMKLENIERSDYLPKNIFKLSDNVADTYELDHPIECTHEYERHIVYSHAYVEYLHEIANMMTPVPLLETERKKRIAGLKIHLKSKKNIRFPNTRRFGQKASMTSFEYIMHVHEKYAKMFGKIIKKNK
ncbi:hypothetical protein NY2A_B671L [Paramecium bursaria Chlorella virus NY2A]|uniref:Uncharacterized protein B671L n=1 Tax=Paramecium bursaria Chlorella virus NY2A TaxID=46021 RepID=A7IXJ6_PBCVN|nr:hypothetical protein NY2A_B671L [Paramecium bursaria Chlorella virus NY2A]ABT15070.1 hypothetical protein NY2A_B671L [Paramecium bursaria Chlorella virus NY2A]